MTNAQTIYVELVDEGVVVYRPVEATPDPDGVTSSSGDSARRRAWLNGTI